MQDAAETRTSAQITPSSLAISSVADEGRFVPGTLIVGRYRIISLLGRGGMGEVYRATDLTLGQPVALKFLPKTIDGFERMLERFQNEVRVARQVSHPNVCRVYDLGEFEGMPYMSMEYVDGEDLSGLLSRIGRLPADKALDIARKLCAGLAAAHDKGVIHRDLKPANIMLDKRGNAIIMDFGLAAVTNELRGAEARSGSPAYQAPEQLRGEEVTAKSDIYALGLVLYEVFTGKRAYEAKSIADLIRIQEEAQFISMTSHAAEIDPTVEKAIRKCLNPVAIERPASALTVSAQLPGGDPLAAALAAGETPSPELVAAAGRSQGLALKYSIPLALAVVSFIAAVPFLRHNHETHSFVPHNLPPPALTAKIQEFAASFGYPEVPADSVMWLTNQSSLIENAVNAAVAANQGAEALRTTFAAESPVVLVYRQSPVQLITPDGRVTLEQPAPVTAGMLSALINTAGELRRFSAVPSQIDGAPQPTPVDTALISRALGFDLNALEPTAPKFTPFYAADWQQSWKGKHPRLGTDIQIDSAAWHGKLTHLEVIWPWTIASRMPEAHDTSLASKAPQLVWNVAEVLVFLIGSILAARNLRAGRGDRTGAVRLAIFVFFLSVVSRLGSLHWTADSGMFNRVITEFSFDLAGAGSAWLIYLAVEPAVRARWPRVMVSWTRILRGQWNDPHVAMRVLQGALVGCIIDALVLIPGLLRGPRAIYSNTTDPSQGISTGYFLSDLARLARNGIEMGMLLIFALFVFRIVLKKDWAAAFAMSLVLTAMQPGNWRNPSLVDVVFYAVIMAGIAFVLLRLGLVAAVVAITYIDLLLHTPGAQDLTKWYEWTVIAYPLAALIPVIWAFWRTSSDEIMRTEPDAIT